MVPEAQARVGNIREMLSVTYDNNSKGTRTTATTKSDSFDKKTKSSSAPSLENSANNDVSSRGISEKSANGVVGLTVISGNHSTEDAPMDVVHVVHSNSTRERNLSNFQHFETKNLDGYDSDG